MTYILKENLEINRDYRDIKNINCGQLRRIGKTTTIKNLCNKERETGRRVGVLVPILRMGDQYKGEVDLIFTPKSMDRLRGQRDMVVYSDEVPEAESLLQDQPNVEYRGGFYSRE